MNNDTKSFKQAVNSYYKNKELSDEKMHLLSELTKNIDTNNVNNVNNVNNEESSTHRRRSSMWSISISAIAASLLVAVIMVGFQQQPEIITAAYHDINFDSHLNNGFAQQQKEWIAVNHISPAPAQYKVEMSKFCELAGHTTTHLRIAGTEQGKMNIFFKKGLRPYRFGKKSGKKDDMYWKVLESKQDFTVIVLYTEDMRENVVNQIINKMVPDLIV